MSSASTLHAPAAPVHGTRPVPRNAALALTLVLALALLVLPWLFTLSPYVMNILMQLATYAIAVLGLVVLLGYTGQINLAQASFFGIGAYAVGLGTVVLGMNFWLALVMGVAVATVAGFALGLTTLRLGGHYLAMITISFQQIFDLVMVNWSEVTRGPDGVASIARPSVFGFELGDDRGFLVLCALILYACLAAVWWLPKTRLGRAMQAVRENQLAAEVTGVNTLAVKAVAFTLSSALAALGGGLFAAGFAYISPDNFNFGHSVNFLTMALLGGVQSAFGAVIGSGLLIVLPEWLRFLKEIYMAVYGVAVILIMVFMPEGIWGLLKNAAQRRWHGVRTGLSRITPLPRAALEQDTRPILTLTGIAKHFGGVKAVDGLDFEVRRGSCHALIGPNGSGKTTTLNVLNGIYKPTAGKLVLAGQDVTEMSPSQRAGLGLGRTFQNIRLFASMSVLENVMIGAQRKGNPIAPGEAALRERALSALQFVGMAERADEVVKNLPYGHQRLVEIARALAGQPTLLLLDEPAAGLNNTEKQELVGLLKRLREAGYTVFLIEHDMGLIEQVADHITVLNFGRKIAEGAPAEVLRHPEVMAAYLGESGDNSHAAA